MLHKTAFFTICSNNYLPYAQILFNSLKIHHPEAELFLCLADIQAPPLQLPNVTVIEAKELNIPTFEDFAFRYDVMEFNTAIKPFMMNWLLEEQDFQEVIYLDPDIEVFAPLQLVLDSLRQGNHFALTPHLTRPAEINAYPNDIDIMKAGIYNLGFIAVNNHPDVYDFLHWWGRRLRFQCINQQDQGIFVDQKFVDLLPAFFDKVAILRNTNLNVAYWNLEQRELSYDLQLGNWRVDGEPLIFFHFSGINPKNRYRLSKHTTHFDQDLPEALQQLIDHYIEQYYQNLSVQYNNSYYYDYFENHVKITTLMRQFYRNLDFIWLDNPFTTFHQYLNEADDIIITSHDTQPLLVTHLMYVLWLNNDGLKASFDLETSAGIKSYMYWFIQHAFLYQIDPYFIKPVLDCLAKNLAVIPPLTSYPHHTSNLVGVIGYLKAETGVGQAARSLIHSLKTQNLSVQGYDVKLNVMARRQECSVDNILSNQIFAPIHVYHINGDQLGLVKENITNDFTQADYQICIPFWELSFFPNEWVSNFEGINEIWVGSEFVRGALQPKFTIPVYCFPPAVTLGSYRVQPRSFFDLPEDTFLFHFNFDFASYSSRKNPEAVISAYRKAFHSHHYGIPTALVIKVRGYDPDNCQLNQLLESIREEQDIIVINQQLSYTDSVALMNCCDCYISLHRSEGFGYTLAEAMLLGKPVIATDFSATKDFINPETGFPVNYKLISLQPGDYPFAENQYWADPDVDHAAWLMRYVASNSSSVKKIAYNGQDYIKTFHSLEAAGKRYFQHLQEIKLIEF